jgi:hypothetical protein
MQLFALCPFLLVAPFFHVPPGSVPEGGPLRIAGRMARDAVVVVYYRAGDTRQALPQFTPLPPRRTEQGEFVAEIPADAVEPPGFEYYIEADGRPVFASQEAPYFVTVLASEETILSTAALRRNDGKRSRARVFGEYVDFGSRVQPGAGAGAADLADRYVRLEGDYAYSLYRTVYSIRIGGGLLRGSTFEPSFQGGPSPYAPASPGLDYGFAELRFRLAEHLFLDGRGLLGATDAGFQAGGRAALLFGAPEGVYVQVGGELVGRIGAEAFLRMHWDTIPTVPMAVTIALSDFPSHDRPTGVRVNVDASHDLGLVTLALRLGYQARDTEVGGATLGLGLERTF